MKKIIYLIPFLLFGCIDYSETFTLSEYIGSVGGTKGDILYAQENYIIPPPVRSHPDIPNFDEKAKLGRMLFFAEFQIPVIDSFGDIQTFEISCATCHDGSTGFTDPFSGQSIGAGALRLDHPNLSTKPIKSFEFDSDFGMVEVTDHIQVVGLKSQADIPPGKSPSAISIVGNNSLLWSGAASGDIVEFSEDDKVTKFTRYMTHPAIIQSMFAESDFAHRQRAEFLNVKTTHPKIYEEFKKCYPNMTDEKMIQDINIAECIAAFEMKDLIPDNSRHQNALKDRDELTLDEWKGFTLFDAKCATCHKPPFLGSDEFVNLGFPDLINEFNDGSHPFNKGRGGVTGYPEDMGKFRVMNLNTNLVDHLTFGHGANLTLNQAIDLHDFTTEEERDLIVKFLGTLIDEDLRKIN